MVLEGDPFLNIVLRNLNDLLVHVVRGLVSNVFVVNSQVFLRFIFIHLFGNVLRKLGVLILLEVAVLKLV